MKNISFILLFLFFLFSCNKSFKSNLNKFGEPYSKSFNDENESHLLPKCWNGWFELRIKKSDETIDGVVINKFELAPELSFLGEAETVSFEFFSYIAFIDEHRLVFYTPLKNRKKKRKNDFNLYAKQNKDFQRGYYTYKHKTASENTGLLEMSIENQRRERLTELTFEVNYKKNEQGEYEILTLKLITMIDKDDTDIEQSSKEDERVYVAENLFSFQPTYYFEKFQTLNLSAKSKEINNGIETKVDSIFLDKTNKERFYYFNNKLQFKELLSIGKEVRGGERDTLATW